MGNGNDPPTRIPSWKFPDEKSPNNGLHTGKTTKLSIMVFNGETYRITTLGNDIF